MSTPRNLSDRYELGDTLGFGGMSEVHSGRDLRLGRDVAVKVLRADLARDPSFYLRFRREAQNAAALNHPAIVAVYDTGEAQDDEGQALPYIVMERVEGETLRDALRNDGPLTPRRAMEVMGDVCAALDFSHRHGIVHRDVKPANIMINRAGAVKVMDFGIARAIADGTSTMTQTAAVIGTAQYLSPEQARGEQVDARSDVYSAGCVLFELLTAEPPFTGDSPVAVAYQHVREDPRLPSQLNAGVPPELDSVVLKAMSKNPANRYQSAGEMRTDLVRVLAGQRPTAPAVMTDDDRTELLGAVAPGPPGKHRGGGVGERAERAPQRRSAEVGPGREGSRRRALLLAVAAIVGVLLVVLVTVFLNALNSSPTRVAVPPVAGQSSDMAQNTLTAANLTGRVTNIASSEVARDAVVRTDPPSGTSVDEGSLVTIFVSTGPEQVQVPTVVNLTQAQATAALQTGKLVGRTAAETVASDTVAAGSVVSSNPAAGTAVDAGSAVTLTISSGKQQVRVPSVVGNSEADATANLKDAGFNPTSSPVDSTAAAGTVVAQDPGGNAQSTRGAGITISVSRGNRIAMPDLVGQSRADVLAVLAAARYTGGEGNLTATPTTVSDPAQADLVLTQDPAADAVIEPNQPLRYSYGVVPAPTTTTPPPPPPPSTTTTAPPTTTPTTTAPPTTTPTPRPTPRGR